MNTLQPECDISVSKLLGFETFPMFWMVSDSVSKKFGIEKSIGFGIGKKLVSKKYRIRYRKYLVSEKSFGFGFLQIFGIVTHCLDFLVALLSQKHSDMA